MYYLYKHELLKFSLLNTQMPDVQYVFWQKQKYIKKIIVKKRKEWRKAFLILNIKNGSTECAVFIYSSKDDSSYSYSRFINKIYIK